MGKISSSVTEMSDFATEPAFSNEHIEIFVKKRVARQDLGNRTSPLSHMSTSKFL